ncbi:MAG: hypothetical protein J5J00_16910 [Deltaproteobacteria bacterium]|nr:hypothetical protein [Deltaproteobacteria bacterium]
MRPVVRRQRASVNIEAALSSAAMLTTVCIAMQIAVVLFRQVSLQFAVNETARWAAIENVQFSTPRSFTVSPYSSSQIKAKLTAEAARFGISLNPSDIKICPFSDPGCAVEVGSAAPGLFIITVQRQAPFSFGFFTASLSAQAIARREG